MIIQVKTGDTGIQILNTTPTQVPGTGGGVGLLGEQSSSVLWPTRLLQAFQLPRLKQVVKVVGRIALI